MHEFSVHVNMDFERHLRLRLLQVELLDLQLTELHARMREEEQEEAVMEERRRRPRKPRSVWTREWVLRRPIFGTFDQLMQELNREDDVTYANFLRMDQQLFQELLQRVEPEIQKDDTQLRPALQAGLKLAVTLRYLATGNTYKDLSFQFRVPPNTISVFIPEVCEALIDALKDEVMPEIGATEDYWRDVSYKFLDRWNMPHCLGAIDGKHVRIKKPAKSGSAYFNYKKYFSKVLFAICGADYKFLYCEVGANGACGDATLWNLSTFHRHIIKDKLNIPPDERLPGAAPNSRKVPFFFISDDALAIAPYLQKPYSRRQQQPLTVSQRVFNYRISRARRVVEAAFGILAQRFQCLLRGLTQTNVDTMDSVILACVYLHNLLITRKPGVQQRRPERILADIPDVLDDTEDNPPRKPRKRRRQPPPHQRAERYPSDIEGSEVGGEIQKYLTKYFLTEQGSVNWQMEFI